MDLGLAGKKAIVTGGTRGIGLAVARSLAAEGCALGIIARGAEGLSRARQDLGAEVHTRSADVTDAAAFERAFAELVGALGGLDVAVSSAGGSLAGAALDAPDEVWRAQWELNFLASERLVRASAAAMKNGGSIVLLSSISAFEAFGHPAYIASKAPLHALAKVAAREGAARGVRVNCVAPGSILFPGGSWDRRMRQDPERIARMVEETLPAKRFGTPEEVANVAVFLASPRASWVTGTYVVVDGSQSVSI